MPDLDAIYSGAARRDAEERRPLIAVPGILGSRLVDTATGIVVWGGGPDTAGASVSPDTPEGAELIALPIGDGTLPLAALRDGVEAEAVLDTLHADILGLPLDIDVYGGILRTLASGGFRLGIARDGGTREGGALPGESFDSFQFAYDWRRDIVESAQALGRFIRRRRATIIEERYLATGAPPAQAEVTFDIICHSMGTLVVRYYLMYGDADLPAGGGVPPLTWAGAEHVGRVVFVAPPNAGSPVSFENLVNGKEIGPFQPVFPAALLATHPAIFQLMPRARHGRVRWGGAEGAPVSLYDPAIWERFGWGLATPDSDALLAWLMPDEADPARRRARALAHQAVLLRRAEQLHLALDRAWEPAPPPGLDLYLVAGSGFRTPSDASVDSETGAVALSGVEEGDGVVTRASVLLDERQGADPDLPARRGLMTPLSFRSILFLPEEHLELTRSPVFGDNLLFWLLEAPRPAADLAVPRGGGDLLPATAAAAAPLPPEPRTPD